MSYLFFILPVLVVVGAFMWLKPSPRDQRLAKLRADALINGFRITSLKVNDNSEQGRISGLKQIVTLYELSLVLVKENSSRFVVQRTTGESGAFLPEGWAWDDRQNLNDQHYQALAAILRGLPESIQLLALRSDTVGLSWNEADAGVSYDTLKEPLIDCAKAFHRQAL